MWYQMKLHTLVCHVHTAGRDSAFSSCPYNRRLGRCGKQENACSPACPVRQFPLIAHVDHTVYQVALALQTPPAKGLGMPHFRGLRTLSGWTWQLLLTAYRHS